MMTKNFLAVIATLLGLTVQAQNSNAKIKEGNDLYDANKFDEAEVAFRRALNEEGKNQALGNFNLGDALYKQERYAEALEAYEKSLSLAENKVEQAEALHNIGNTHLQEKKLEEAIEAYKKSLTLNPKDEETRYNLSQAIRQKQKQEQQQDKNKDQDKKDDKKDDQKKDQDKKDEDKKDDQKKDGENKEDQEQKDQDQKEDDKQDPTKSPSPGKDKISRENAERLLQALNRDEEKLQQKLLQQKIKAKPIKSAKDW